jgi:hypothetical protein
MSPASSKKISFTFNTFNQSLTSAWSLPGTFEGGKIATLQNPAKTPKFMSDQTFFNYGQII